MTSTNVHPSPGGGRLRTAAAVALLGAVFGVALLAPMPTVQNTVRAEVLASVEKRLPGWDIVRARSSWEGAWTVVAGCGIQRLGFQWVPNHGLQPGDAWLHPEDAYARSRLAEISDDYRFLVWLGDPVRQHTLSCRQEMARIHAGRIGGYLD
ncbi:MAG TPA: hypothetical protein VH987_02770 [Candidatus Limnocylindria bacterium]|jgi:hypothetical protein